MRTALFLILLAALPARADPPMSEAQFEAATTGQTIIFSDREGPYGAEQYLPGRRVFWSHLDGDCLTGSWYQDRDRICFVYEGISAPQCWFFHLADHGLWARFAAGDDPTTLYETERSAEPLYCKGPLVGS